MNDPKRLTQPRFIAGAVVALAAMLLSACSAIPEKTQTPTTPSQPQQAAGPQKGGKLTLIQTGDPGNLNTAPMGIQKSSFLANVFNTPTQMDAKGQPQPEVAESWTFNTDRTELTVKLRQGVKFHSGREFKAEDLVNNILRLQKPEVRSQLLSMVKPMSPVKVDDYTVKITFSSPPNNVFDAFNQMWLVDTTQSEEAISQKPNGTGPFVVVEYIPGQSLKLTRFDGYFRAGLPYLDEVIIQYTNDPASMAVNLEARAVDVLRQPANNEHERLKKAGMQVIVSTEPTNTYDYAFNTTAPPFDNKKVRQAMNYAIDRQRIVTTALHGVGKPICVIWPEASWAYHREMGKACSFNLEKAKQLLAEAGYPNGFEFTIYTSTGVFPDHNIIAQIVQADLAKIGVKMNVVDLEAPKWVDEVNGAKFKEVAAHLFGFANKDPGLIFTARPFVVGNNISRFVNAEYAQLIADAAATADQAKRKAAYMRIQEIMIDEAFVVPISPQYRSWAMQPYVNGFKANLDDADYLEGVWLKK